MSLTINSYLNSSLQDVRTTSAEKLGQKGKEVEVGKTRESAVSASLDQVNMGEDGTAVTEVGRQQGAEQTDAQKQFTTPHMDTVEISETGKAASARLQTRQADSDAAEGYQLEVEDLSEYTDTELKQMYYRGEITRQEYEEETGETLE